jgi:CRP/FNR family transcriptional regulator, cyclic AMP receptor protein
MLMAAASLPENRCRLDDRGDTMMAAAVGTVRVSLPTAKGNELIPADLRPGELLGEIALLDGRPRSANATAPPIASS